MAGEEPPSHSMEYNHRPGICTRLFTTQPEHFAILSESAAQRLWPGQNPIGRSLRLGTGGQFHKTDELLPDGPTWQVIGVARDTRGVTLDGSDFEEVYLPLPSDRLQSNPTPVMRAMDPVISAVDPSLVASTSTLQDMLRQTDAFLIDSLSAAIASSISLFGLLLASMGIYSTVSYIVVLRIREVGIRMAMGAQKRDIFALIDARKHPSRLCGIAGRYGWWRSDISRSVRKRRANRRD